MYYGRENFLKIARVAEKSCCSPKIQTNYSAAHAVSPNNGNTTVIQHFSTKGTCLASVFFIDLIYVDN